jgi:hypothetical protein
MQKLADSVDLNHRHRRACRPETELRSDRLPRCFRVAGTKKKGAGANVDQPQSFQRASAHTRTNHSWTAAFWQAFPHFPDSWLQMGALRERIGLG